MANCPKCQATLTVVRREDVDVEDEISRTAPDAGPAPRAAVFTCPTCGWLLGVTPLPR
jgi:hypothetical protein